MSEAKLGVAFVSLLRRDLMLTYRNRAQMLNPLLFFVIVVSLFPLGLDPQPELLRTIAPGVIWVAALLASMLSLDNMFRSDFDDGSLEQLLLTPHPLPLLVLAKILAHWLVSGLPLLLLAPVLGMLLNLASSSLLPLMATLALGTPEPDRLNRGGAHSGPAWGRGAAVTADTAAVHTGADLCGQRGGQCRRRAGYNRSTGVSRLPAGAGAGAGAAGHGCGFAY